MGYGEREGKEGSRERRFWPGLGNRSKTKINGMI
jgi:hypothetical protein